MVVKKKNRISKNNNSPSLKKSSKLKKPLRQRAKDGIVNGRKKFISLFTPIRILRLSLLVFLVVFLSLTIGREILTVGQGSISSYILVHFAGYLFFFILPVEALVPYYHSLGFIPELLFIIAILTAITAQVIDYWIGRLAPIKITKHIVGEKKYMKIQGFVEKHGAWLIFVFNLFPLSSPIVAAIAGVLNYDFWRWLAYSVTGLVLKYALLLLVLGGN